MFLTALLEYEKPPIKITVVADNQTDKSSLAIRLPLDAIVILLDAPTKEFPMKNEKTTYYVCHNNSCLPPTNDIIC